MFVFQGSLKFFRQLEFAGLALSSQMIYLQVYKARCRNCLNIEKKEPLQFSWMHH